ncbi:RteC domain-containing protein [uncultured Maribacter sp.]|uniref:RteC domain-containing protein n=1 Tax=uncultured Maribacter sp. TaxID=431308 RepID=UPI00260C2F3E|nr:RteC domain-containing protein [uncultured Maribacter sp.]
MKRYKDILKTLGTELDEIETRIEDVLIRAEKGIRLAKKALQETRKLIDKHEFKSEHDEITFFKKIKPSLNSKLIYYVKLFNIESRRPRSSKKSQTKYLNGHIDKLQSFFNENLEFYHYYRRNATSLDEQYFLRNKADIRLLPDCLLFYTDEQFSTSHDSTVATIIAYDMLIVHLKTEIDKLENNNGMEQAMNPFSQQSHLFWTAHKTDLIELIYALHSCGAVNSGTADIKEMAAAFERLYNIDLGNYYHTFVEIRSRKSNNTKFLDKLKTALLKRYEDSDE